MYFDEEPSADHLEKFQNKLSQLKKPETIQKSHFFSSKQVLKVAASISIFLVLSIAALLEFRNLNKEPQLSDELMHVKMYYNQITDEKLAEINNCNTSDYDEMLYETTENRLQKLDNTTKELEHQLGQAHGNKQLEKAYIQSLQAKSEVVNQMYAQMCTNNTNNIITQ